MQSYIVRNGNIFRPDNTFHAGDMYISGDVITSTSPENAEIIDAEGLYIIPGLTDIHFHGCAGHDFCEATSEALQAISDYEAHHGVTTICPSTMTLPENELLRIMFSVRKICRYLHNLVGINLEGPFISPNKIGAQNPEYISRPSVDMLRKLQDASGGLIKIAVVAPEVEGAEDFIRAAKDIAAISIGHTSCDYDTAKHAFELGASHVTHLYNAMNPIKHRDPGPIIAAVETENVDVELICDGVHIHPAVVRNTLRMFGTDRVIFISDSMEATGMKDGIYSLGGQKVIKKGSIATLEDGITIAGSVTNLMDCMKISVRDMGVPLETAVKCAAINPARAIGLDARLSDGNRANLVALDKELNLVWVMREGNIIFPEGR